MAEHTIVLIDGSTAILETRLSISGMREMKKKGLISSKMLTTIANGGNDIDDSLDQAIEAIYIAYVNANPDDHMDKEEFFDLYPYDMINIMQIYSELIGGDTIGQKFAQEFEKVTKTKK